MQNWPIIVRFSSSMRGQIESANHLRDLRIAYHNILQPTELRKSHSHTPCRKKEVVEVAGSPFARNTNRIPASCYDFYILYLVQVSSWECCLLFLSKQRCIFLLLLYGIRVLYSFC